MKGYGKKQETNEATIETIAGAMLDAKRVSTIELDAIERILVAKGICTQADIAAARAEAEKENSVVKTIDALQSELKTQN